MRIFIYLSAFATAVGFLYSWRSPRRMLYLLFYFSLIEGAYINYFYPQQAPLVVKDILVLWTYGLLIAQGQLRTAVRSTRRNTDTATSTLMVDAGGMVSSPFDDSAHSSSPLLRTIAIE